MKKLVLIVTLIGLGTVVHADDKAGTIKTKVAEACGGKAVAASDIPRLMKALYVNCDAGKTADVDGCPVPCLK